VPGYNHEWAVFATYAILSLAFVGVYAAIAKIQPKRSLGVVPTAIAIGGTACVVALSIKHAGGAGWLVPAFEVMLVAIISKKYALLEASTYLAAFALANLIYNVSDMAYSSKDLNLAISTINAHIISLPILIFGFFNEHENTNGARKIVGFIFLATSMFYTTTEANLMHGYVLPVIYIFEFAIIAVVSALLRQKWMTIASAVLITITTLELTGGFNGIWLMLIGMGLIAFVAWQLASNNKKK
jgi:hypothetical protein